MLVIAIISTVLLTINFTCRLLNLFQRKVLDIAIPFDIFCIIAIWILYIN